MAAVSTIIAGASLAVGAASVVSANRNAKKAVAAQNEALDFQRKQSDLAAARQRRDAIRAARQSFAQAQAAAANQGVMDSSSSVGGLESIKSQIGSETSFLDQYNFFSDQASQALGRANVYESRARTGSQLASLGWQGFMNADSIAAQVKKIAGQ